MAVHKTRISALFNPYLMAFIGIYGANLFFASVTNSFDIGDAIGIVVIVGILFSSIAYFITKHSALILNDKPIGKNEIYVLIGLLIYITFTIIGGNKAFFIPQTLTDIPKELATLGRKLLSFVALPFLLYKQFYRFSWSDFGLSTDWQRVFSKKNVLIFIALSSLVLLLNYFGGNAAKPIRDGLFSPMQLLLGLPICFMWLCIEVGLVEEFFFRGLIQNRLSFILKSDMAALCITALCFGLIHAPGMFLRGAGTVEGLGMTPNWWVCVSYCIAIQSIPAFFFGIIWLRTKNLWLLMGIHAAFDLLPNFADFAKTWGI